MFAVIKSGGRQYKVFVGQTLEVNRLPVEAGAQVKIEEVLLISDADRTMLGTPLVENAMVLATATKHARGKKLIVFKYKPKKRYRRKTGHRQELTILTIDDIIADGKSLVTGEAPRSEEEEILEEEEVASPEITTEEEAPVDEMSETEVEEKKSTRRRRTTKAEPAEDTESKSEETSEEAEASEETPEEAEAAAPEATTETEVEEKKTTRRRRTGKTEAVEDSESKAEEE